MEQTIKPSPINFNLIVIGEIISVLGATLLRFALSLYVLDVTGRADLFATLFAVSSIPFLLAPLGGAMADRFNRRKLMVISNFANGIIILVLFLLLNVGLLSLPFYNILLIGVIMVILSTVSSLYAPIVSSSIPFLVPENKLESANGLVQAVQALSGVLAPVLGGILYGIIGLKSIIIISFIAFFLTAGVLMFVKIPFEKRKQDKHIIPTIIQDIKEGFVYVGKRSFIRKAMILAASLNLFLVPLFIVGAPIILRFTMGSGDIFYGIGMGAIELATILGAISIGLFTKILNIRGLYRWVLMISILVLPIGFSVTPIMLNLGFYPSFILFVICSILIAMIGTIVSIYVITKVQKETSNENLGKTMAIIMMVSQCATPVGQVIYGVLFERFIDGVYIPILFISFVMFVLAYISKVILKNEETNGSNAPN